jgi:hypothetical protein
VSAAFFFSVQTPPSTKLAKQHGVRSDYFIADVNGRHLAQLAQMHER